MMRPLMGLRGTNWVVALLVVVVVALVLLFCAIVLSTEPTTAELNPDTRQRRTGRARATPRPAPTSRTPWRPGPPRCGAGRTRAGARSRPPDSAALTSGLPDRRSRGG